MTHQFPAITTYGAAFRFALAAEQACADFGAAAGVVAPDQAWRDKLEEIVCTHDDRVQKLQEKLQEAGAAALDSVQSLDGAGYMGTLDAEPATSWPAAVEQLIRAEADAARYHEDFAAQCGEALAAMAVLFAKSAAQDRAAAAELLKLLD